MSQNCLRAPQIQFKSLIVNELRAGCPLLGKPASYGARFWSIWKPFGTLWKDFSSFTPFLRLGTNRELVGDQFYWYMLFIFSELIDYQFKNISIGLSTLWKPDCAWSSVSLGTAMGTLWR
jgi:hypothetical protein